MIRISLLYGLIWFGAFVACQWTILALTRVERRGALTLALFAIAVLCQATIGGLVGALVMACLFVLYMPFYYTVAASLSVQTLILLLNAGGRLDTSTLKSRFAAVGLVEGRLRTMRMNGYLLSDGERFCLTPRGRLIARRFEAIKRLWKLGPGG